MRLISRMEKVAKRALPAAERVDNNTSYHRMKTEYKTVPDNGVYLKLKSKNRQVKG